MRRSISGLAAAAVAIMALAAVPPANDRPASARTTVRLIDVGVDASLADRLTAALGDLQFVSGRLDEGPADALLGLVGAQAMGSTAGERGWSTSERGDRGAQRGHRGDASVPVSGGGIDGVVRLLGYAVEASGRDARSELTGLEGRLAAGPVALQLGSGARGITTSITGDTSEATTSLALSSVDLRLGDLLPDGLLDRLPLGVVLDLIDRLPVSLPEVEALVAQLEELVAGLREVAGVAEQISETREQLVALVGDDPAVVAATAAVTDAEAALAVAQKELTAAVAARDAVPTDGLQTTLDAALATEAAAVKTVTSAEQTLAKAGSDLAAAVLAHDGAKQDLKALEDELAQVEAKIASLDPVLDILEIAQLNDEADGLKAQIVTAEDEVATLATAVTAAGNGVTEATTDLTAAEATLASAREAVAGAEKALSDAQAAVSSAQAAVDAARAAVSAARDTVQASLDELDRALTEAARTVGGITTKLTERLTELRGELTGVLDQVRTIAIALPDLGDLLDHFRDAVADVPVVSLGELGITVELSADARSASAVVDCDLGSLTVLGRSIAAPTCAEANQLIAGVPDLLAELLSALPIEVPVPSISGLDVRTTATDAPDANGVTRASAAITGLRVQVPAVKLSGILDRLTAELEGLLGTALDAEGLLASAPPTVPFGMTRQAVAPPAGALAQLRAQLDGLPVGGALDGLRTVGIDVTVASLQSEVLSGMAVLTPLDLNGPLPGLPAGAPDGPASLPPPAAPGTPTGSPGIPTGGPDDPTGAPGDPDGPSLPVTGGGAVLLPAALMLAAALLRRRS